LRASEGELTDSIAEDNSPFTAAHTHTHITVHTCESEQQEFEEVAT